MGNPEDSVAIKTEVTEPMETTEVSSEAVETKDDVINKSKTSEEDKETEVKEEPQDEAEVKTEEAEVPESSLDDSGNFGNLTADAGVTTAPSFNIAANIKFNITSQASAPGSPAKEETSEGINTENPDSGSVKTEAESAESEFDPDCIIQEKSNEDLENPYRNKQAAKEKSYTRGISNGRKRPGCIWPLFHYVMYFHNITNCNQIFKENFKDEKKLKISKNSKK